MKLCRMKTQYAGPAGTCDAGGTIKLSDDEAEALRCAGYAEIIDQPATAAPAPVSEVETAAEDPAEAAVTPAPRRRGRG